jgi:hypothetical protein
MSQDAAIDRMAIEADEHLKAGRQIPYHLRQQLQANMKKIGEGNTKLTNFVKGRAWRARQGNKVLTST